MVISNTLYNNNHDNECAMQNQLFIDQNKSSFIMVQVTHLEVNFGEIFISTLIEFLRLFPDLDSLKVSCRSLIQQNCLPIEGLQTFGSLKNNNKLTKLSLWVMNKIEDICFLIDLFPHVEYLEVDCTNIINRVGFLQSILTSNTISIRPLSSMCLYIQNINNELIKELETTIEEEHLLNDYTIKCINNERIYLKWK